MTPQTPSIIIANLTVRVACVPLSVQIVSREDNVINNLTDFVDREAFKVLIRGGSSNRDRLSGEKVLQER